MDNQIPTISAVSIWGGGDIKLLKESKEQGSKTPDFLWNGRNWELKGVTTLNSIDRAIREAAKQIQDNPRWYYFESAGCHTIYRIHWECYIATLPPYQSRFPWCIDCAWWGFAKNSPVKKVKPEVPSPANTGRGASSGFGRPHKFSWYQQFRPVRKFCVKGDKL